MTFSLVAFTSGRVNSVQLLHSRLVKTSLLSGWVDTSYLAFCKVLHQPSRQQTNVIFTLTVSEQFEWTVTVFNHSIRRDRCQVLMAIEPTLDTVSNVDHLLSVLNDSKFFWRNE